MFEDSVTVLKYCRMKATLSLLLITALSGSLPAADSSTNSAPEKTPAVANAPPAALSFLASAATLTAPIVFNGDHFSQPDKTELTDGGKAVFNFTVTNAGTSLICAVVNATDKDSNSFFVNVDASPEDPVMIRDMAVTSGFEERTASWRRNGDVDKSEFATKTFKLTAGEHKLILVGREPVKLKSISIRAAGN